MKHKFSWTQAWYGIAHLSPIERIANVESTVRDFNVGTQNLRFKILAVEPIKDGKYRIRLNASTTAVKRITSIWSEGMNYTLDGKRRRT